MASLSEIQYRMRMDAAAFGLGSAASEDQSFFATSVQGGKADSALQPNGDGSALSGLTKSQVGLGNADNTSDTNKPVSTAQATAIGLKLDVNGSGASLTGLTKSQVSLGNVDNTSDVNKPVSTAQSTAIGLKLNTNGSGASLTGLTKAQVGLSNVIDQAISFGASGTFTVGIVSVPTKQISIGATTVASLVTV